MVRCERKNCCLSQIIGSAAAGSAKPVPAPRLSWGVQGFMRGPDWPRTMTYLRGTVKNNLEEWKEAMTEALNRQQWCEDVCTWRWTEST